MNNKKSYYCAAALALGSYTSTSHALTVTSWTLMDFDSDGLQSEINPTDTESMGTPATGNGVGTFGSANELCGATPCADIAFDAGPIGANLFTTGFNYGGVGDYQPIIFGNIAATIDSAAASLGDGQALQFSALDFGIIYQATQYDMTSQSLFNCTGATPGALNHNCGESMDENPNYSNPLGYNVEISDLGGGDYGVVLRYIGIDYGKPLPYFAYPAAHFRIEGIMHTAVPLPASLWLFGSGMFGLIALNRRRNPHNTAYTAAA